jgi:predicted nucleotidyltransferase component of viral defense system
LHDNLAMKLSAITNRGAKKDFFDLHHLIKVFGLKEIIEI